MKHGIRTGSRVAVVTALVGMLAMGAVGATTASAELQSFTGDATGYALKVTVDLSGLPASVKTAVDSAWATAYAALPQQVRDQGVVSSSFPYKFEEYFLKSSATGSGSATKAVSTFADGTVPAQKDWVVSADASGQVNKTQINSANFLKPVDTGLVNLDVVGASAAILEAAVSAGPKVDGNATLAQVNASLQGIAALLPADIKTAFSGVLATVNATLADAQSTFNTTVNGAAAAAESAIAGTPVAAALQTAGVDPTNIAGQLNLSANLSVPDPLSSTSFATLTKLVNKSTAQRSNSIASSDAVSTIESASILDGFVSSGLINLASHSEAAGAKGSAKNTSSCSIADVRVGGKNGVALDGSHLYVNNTAVPVPPGQVAGVKAQVDDVLRQAGITVSLCDTAKATAAEDGSQATQAVSAFTIDVNPKVPANVSSLPQPVQDALTTLGLSAGQALGIHVNIDPTVQTAAQAVPTAPAQLPRTGAGAAASAVAGIALMGGGLFAWRRSR